MKVITQEEFDFAMKDNDEYAECLEDLVKKYVFYGIDFHAMHLNKLDLHNADFSNANLDGVDFSESDLHGAHFEWASCCGTDFGFTNLESSDFNNADLSCAIMDKVNLGFAVLDNANLTNARLVMCRLNNTKSENSDFYDAEIAYCNFDESDLCYASFEGAKIRDTSFEYSNLSHVCFEDAHIFRVRFNNANLNSANFYNSDLSLIDFDESQWNSETRWLTMVCPKEGSFIGYKKVSIVADRYAVVHGIAKLLIPEDAKRSSATTRKCRCSKAKVLSITTMDGEEVQKAYSMRYPLFDYEVGKTVEVKDFDEDRWNECSTGIHFFMDEYEARAY